MDLEQFWMVKIAEECQEVSQRALKLAQFGAEDVEPGQKLNNLERLQEEITDLMIVIGMARDHPSLRTLKMSVPVEKRYKKQEKIEKWLRVSKELGKVV